MSSPEEYALTEWAHQNSARDGLVLAAYAAGVSKNQIHKLTGLARTTIDRIVSQGPEHDSYPHNPGELYDCQACESECYCDTQRNFCCIHCAMFLGMES